VNAAVDRWWREVVPAERLAAVRVLVGAFALVYLAVRLPYLFSYATFNPDQFRPVGIVAMFLDRPLLPVVVKLVTVATLVAGAAFVVGWRFRVTGPVFAALLLWTLTYRNSWGMVFHTENLVVMHVLVLGLTRSADAYSLDARRRGERADPDGRYGWPLRLMCAIVVIAYVLAGWAKLRNGGMDWLWGDELRNHIAIDNARKALLGDIYSPFAGPILHWGAAFKILAFMTVAVEIAAPVAMIGRRTAFVWVALAMAFHFGVLGLMFIAFPYQLTGIAYASFFRAEKLFEWLGRVRERYKRDE
jgi:hypothetical protein